MKPIRANRATGMSRLSWALGGWLLLSGLPAGGQEPGTAGEPESADRRELKAGDTVRYRIDEDPTASAEPIRAMVNASGDLHLSVSRRSDVYVTVSVRGKTLVEIRQEFKAKLDADYYVDATVTVDLDNVDRSNNPLGAAGRVTFFGGAMQGPLGLPEDKDLLLSDAILMMSRSPYADLTRVRVHRVDPVTRKSQTLVINVDQNLTKGRPDEDLVLKDGDRIEVRERLFRL